MVANTPGLAEVLAKDWRKAGLFYARWGITEVMFRHWVSSVMHNSHCFSRDQLFSPVRCPPSPVAVI